MYLKTFSCNPTAVHTHIYQVSSIIYLCSILISSTAKSVVQMQMKSFHVYTLGVYYTASVIWVHVFCVMSFLYRSSLAMIHVLDC